jgi:hypothetical protein
MCTRAAASLTYNWLSYVVVLNVYIHDIEGCYIPHFECWRVYIVLSMAISFQHAYTRNSIVDSQLAQLIRCRPECLHPGLLHPSFRVLACQHRQHCDDKWLPYGIPLHREVHAVVNTARESL